MNDLGGFREVQQLAYRCAEETAAALEPGVTEKEVAARMRRWLEGHGVDDWFHLPFAWFGDRTAFRGIRIPFQFFPSDRELEEGMPYILDCAPVRDGYTADIGYSGSLGHNPVLDRLLGDLAEHRALIVDQVRERRPLREVYEAVDALAARQGFENRHRKYPFRVIAHQVDRLPAPRRSRSPIVGRFGVRSLRWLARTSAVALRQGWSPLWNDTRFSDHPPRPGLWAVEPHLGLRGVGAKFEELLVVTDDDAFWLDDDLPHVRRWSRLAADAAAGIVDTAELPELPELPEVRS
ncbi:MAG TPA: M24 family metallopeptidase [Acidimicrobiales bacterium]|nr:M24 family metallopeptidase [Acidimicrobiales bacterium]